MLNGMWAKITAAAILLMPLVAEDGVRQALDRVAEEASAFQSTAPDMLAVETLRQRAIKPVKKRFRPALGEAEVRGPEWQTREIVSEYGYARMGGSYGFLREFRRPTAVDGVDLPESRRSLDQLATIIRGRDERARRELLEDFEKLGLIGTAIDFGQLLLMFDRRNQENFEFRRAAPRMSGANRIRVIAYRQVNMTAATGITIWRDGKAQTGELVSGEIWCREGDGLPLRITIATVLGQGVKALRQEAEVDYAMSGFGVLVPAAVVHREYRSGGLAAENRFTYSTFRKFGSSSMISFEPSQSQ